MATKSVAPANKGKAEKPNPKPYTRAALSADEIEEMAEIHKKLDAIRDDSCLSDRILAERFEAQAAMLRKMSKGREWA